MTVSPEIQQLQDQQSLLTQALCAMLQGQWCGAPPSVDAFVLALDPSFGTVDCQAPMLESEVPPEEPDYLHDYQPDEEQPAQYYNWSCSACALDWVKRALGLVEVDNIFTSRERTVDEIGFPGNINPVYGLMDGSGAQLQRVLHDNYGQPSNQGWLTFDQAYAIFSQTPGMMSGGAWYHWVGVRGVDGSGNLWVANSAPGYQGVWDTLSRADFNRLGPFSCVWTTP